MVRVHKKEQQNAMNRHIKAVRRMLTLRAKLGGFNSVDWPKVNRDMTKRYGNSREVLNKPAGERHVHGRQRRGLHHDASCTVARGLPQHVVLLE